MGSVDQVMSLGNEETAVDLDDLVSVLLTASRTLVAISAESLAEVEDMLTLSEFRALVVLQAHGGCSVTGLARRLAVSPETAERIVARLSHDEFVRSSAEGITDQIDEYAEQIKSGEITVPDKP